MESSYFADPEIQFFTPIAEEAICRTLVIPPHQLTDRVNSLAVAMLAASLRHDRMAIEIARQRYGDVTAERLRRYLRDTGAEPRELPVPPMWESGVLNARRRRMTPPSVRRLWPIAWEASTIFVYTNPEQQKQLALALSWAHHRTRMLTVPAYREQSERIHRQWLETPPFKKRKSP